MTQIFVDMDGVLADFDTGYEERFGIRPSKADDNVDWTLVRRTAGFYRDLPPMPDFAKLWAGLAWLSPIILTGVPASVEEAAENKLAWVRKHIGDGQQMIACPSKDKSLHIRNPGDVLIDDWEKYRDLWIGRGGRWITHVSAATSLAALANLLGEAPRPSADQMQAACDRFNSKFAVGDVIRVWTGPREGEPVERKVRAPAQILSGHTPVVYVEGGGGCIALTHVEGA